MQQRGEPKAMLEAAGPPAPSITPGPHEPGPAGDGCAVGGTRGAGGGAGGRGRPHPPGWQRAAPHRPARNGGFPPGLRRAGPAPPGSRWGRSPPPPLPPSRRVPSPRESPFPSPRPRDHPTRRAGRWGRGAARPPAGRRAPAPFPAPALPPRSRGGWRRSAAGAALTSSLFSTSLNSRLILCTAMLAISAASAHSPPPPSRAQRAPPPPLPLDNSRPHQNGGGCRACAVRLPAPRPPLRRGRRVRGAARVVGLSIVGGRRGRWGDAPPSNLLLLPAAPEGRRPQPRVEARASRPGDTCGSRCRGQHCSPAAPGVTARERACGQSPGSAPCRRPAPRRLSRDGAASPASSPRGQRSPERARERREQLVRAGPDSGVPLRCL